MRKMKPNIDSVSLRPIVDTIKPHAANRKQVELISIDPFQMTWLRVLTKQKLITSTPEGIIT